MCYFLSLVYCLSLVISCKSHTIRFNIINSSRRRVPAQPNWNENLSSGQNRYTETDSLTLHTHSVRQTRTNKHGAMSWNGVALCTFIFNDLFRLAHNFYEIINSLMFHCAHDMDIEHQRCHWIECRKVAESGMISNFVPTSLALVRLLNFSGVNILCFKKDSDLIEKNYMFELKKENSFLSVGNHMLPPSPSSLHERTQNY